MSIVYEVICDGCGELEGEVHQSEQLAWDAAKAAGWRYVDPTGHLCDVCLRGPT